jgi:hypothetical protein
MDEFFLEDEADCLLTIDLVARSARCWMGGSDHIRCLESNGDHEIMNLLEIEVCHGDGGIQRTNCQKVVRDSIYGNRR